MKKCLIMIDDKFHNNEGLSFSTKEISYFTSFDQIILLSCYDNVLDQTLCENKKITFLHCKRPTKKDYIFMLPKLMCNPLLYSELRKLIKRHMFSSNHIRNLLRFLIMTEYLYAAFAKQLMNLKLESDMKMLIYSYWMHYQVALGIKLKKRLYKDATLITRTHGYDLYEYRSQGYLPLREYILSSIDRVYCISKDGEKYLKTQFPEYDKKVFVAKLGTMDNGRNIYTSRSAALKLVSCSNVVSIKRIDKIIDALSRMNEPVEWTHIGGGELMQTLIDYAEHRCRKNISFQFMGRKTQKELFEVYREKEYHAFVNVSESEGLPVSIMEAMSFEIPAICSNVGGTSEIVEDQYNGILLKPDFTIEELIHSFENILALGEEQYIALRRNARKTWETSYDQRRNYNEFVKELNTLIEVSS